MFYLYISARILGSYSIFTLYILFLSTGEDEVEKLLAECKEKCGSFRTAFAQIIVQTILTERKVLEIVVINITNLRIKTRL